MRVSIKVLAAAATAAGVILVQAASSMGALVAQYKVADYNATTGVWTDSSGNANNATAQGVAPTISTNVTPNGSSAVNFVNAGYLQMATGFNITGSTGGFTILAFLSRAATDQGTIIAAENNGAFNYRIAQDRQNLVRTNTAEEGTTDQIPAVLAANTFYSLNIRGNLVTPLDGSEHFAYRLNGAADGSRPSDSSAFTNDLVKDIGGGANGPDNFDGLISEIRVYDTELSTSDIQTIESQFNASYVSTATPEPASLGLLALMGSGLVSRRRRRSAVAVD